ncbi:MAG: succinate dehydrogenase iron-sulfur subunit [Nitrospirae bacterium]|nr:succinate dehydrogenase iron-sulfur subunit [Nitrospirota bacterium]
MRVRFSIQRFNPALDAKPRFMSYRVEVARDATVLEALVRIKEEVDGTLAFRASCRQAICGSCSMEINGHEKLACKTQVLAELDRHGEIKIAPLKNMRIVKDLVADMGPFWHKVRDITPWLIPEGYGTIAISPSTMKTFDNVDACIMCGACLAACNSNEVSEGFLGPAALAKSYRFIADPREGNKKERLLSLQHEDGIWDCVRCNFCVEVCPKDVKPMEQIIKIRRASIQEGMRWTKGSRHITGFLDIVKREGRLNEAAMPLKLIGTDIAGLLRIIPLGIRMLIKGKVPLHFKRGIEGIKDIRRIFRERGL